MTQDANAPGNTRSTWVRGLLMLIMALAYHVATTVLFFVAIIQFVIALAADSPNARLTAFGRSLGSYLRQIVNFLTFVTEDLPFPFSDWPSGEQ